MPEVDHESITHPEVMPPSAVSVEDFLRLLHGDVPGVLEFRALPSTSRCFLTPDNLHGLTAFLRQHLHEDCYVGIAVRRDATSGAVDNCAALTMLFIDLDFKHMDERMARHRLTDFPFAPAVVIRSGHGLHVYWLLREPFDLSDVAARSTVTTLLRRLAHGLGGDLVSAEPARILRLPNTHNFKYEPPRLVTIETFAPDRVYHLDAFDEILPPAPDPPLNGTTFVLPSQILDGERNTRRCTVLRARSGRNSSPPRRSTRRSSSRTPLDVSHRSPRRKSRPSSKTPFASLIATGTRRRTTPPRRQSRSSRRMRRTTPSQCRSRCSLMPARSSRRRFHRPRSISRVCSDDGGGWIAGEEKLGKTFWMLHEAVCLALGEPVAGRFAVPTPRRVAIIEEEDSPRRTHRRLRAIVAGLGVNPDDPKILTQLAERLHVAVWQGVTLDVPAMVKRLDDELGRLTPDVCYIDVLRKITARDLNKGEHAGWFLGELDRLRRQHGVLFRIVAHNRKVQGMHRAGRGSQELAGSNQLGAWGENSLFFAPIGKKAGQVKIEVQGKDLPPAPAFRLIIESEGPPQDPHLDPPEGRGHDCYLQR